jgi:oxygen-independent coproporphyrinogen III oxidase
MPGVYFSYPFCLQKCTFCNFASGVSSAAEQREYELALLEEVQGQRWPWRPETVYWGGGTPSLMPLESFAAVMRAIPGENWQEVTIECAPGTIDREKAVFWRRCGVNRVSLGVQSFVAAEAQRTGRRHDAETVARDVAVLREAGIRNLSVDLIAGLPGQTYESWQESLHWIERLEIPHASVYLFEVDEDSNLGRETLLGGVRYGAGILPSEEATADFYQIAVGELARMGLKRYEISNFASEGYESRHNLKYWQLEPYFGFGVDAHSFDGQRRWANPDTVHDYLAARTKAAPQLESTISDPEEEHLFVGLRQASGIEPTESEWRRFEAPIQHGIDCGLLQRDGNRLRLTEQGFLLSNEIFQEFIS